MNFGCHAAIISVLLILPSISVGAARFLNVTTTAAGNGNSVVECWQFEDPFTTSTQPGVQGTSSTRLGNLLSGTYSIVPAGTNGGPHNAPAPQYVIFLSGSAKITIPHSTQTAMLRSGMNGLFFAADTAAVSQFGHVTDFVEETILLQIPTAGGIVPPHTILHSGACKGNELVHRSEGRESGSCAAKRQEAHVIEE